jgi:putative DNA methylase
MTKTYNKKLIEVSIPLVAINNESAKEKSLRVGHPSGMHQWWARRPISSCRATLALQLIDDPSNFPEKFSTNSEITNERQRLFDLIEEVTKFSNNGNDELLEKVRNEIDINLRSEQITVLDPFSGSGTISAEALRLGRNAIATDLNPVATIVSKGRTEVFTKFSNIRPVNPDGNTMSDFRGQEGLASDFEYYAKIMREIAFKNVGNHYYSEACNKDETVIAWIWTRTVPSPDPAFSKIEVPLASSFALSAKKKNKVIVVVEPDIENNLINYKINENPTSEELEKASLGTKSGRGANFTCVASGAAITPEYVKKIGKTRGFGAVMIAIAIKGKGGRVYKAPTMSDQLLAKVNRPKWTPETPLSKHTQYMGVSGYGFETVDDLFNDRQLLGLHAMYDAIAVVREKIISDCYAQHWEKGESFQNKGCGATAYADAITVLLTLSLGKLTDLSNAFCPWRADVQCPSNLFGRQAISMGWTFAEGNIFSSSSGGYLPMISTVKKGILANSYSHKKGNVEIVNDDASNIKDLGKNFVVCTDPPYYDAVPYADLSDFFFPWMKFALKDIFPGIFDTLASPKADELVADRMRHGSAQLADSFFKVGMTRVLSEANNIQNWDFPMCIFYAFTSKDNDADNTSSSGWVAFLESLIDAKLQVVRTWPMRTEMIAGLKAKKNSLATSVLVVCRKKMPNSETITKQEFIRKLKRKLPAELEVLLESNIAPVDIAQAAIGPGMEIFSQLDGVLETDDSPMSVKTALQIINSELDEFLNHLHGDFDPHTRFVITWFEQNGYSNGEFGVADNLARARGITVNGVKHAGIIKSSAGKVRILKRDELNPDWDPTADSHLTIWECCQYLVREYEEGGETAAAMLIKKMGFEKAESVKDLAYYLYDICSNKRQDANEATSYNSLIAGWNDIMRMTNSNHDTDTTRQASLF